jgi:hypothetical protein
MTMPPKPAGLVPVFALAVALFAAQGCGSENIKLAEVPADATETVLKAQPKETRPQPLPPKGQMSQGRPY